jgi:signal peptidase II
MAVATVYRRAAVVAGLVLVLDQLTKALVTSSVALGTSQRLLPGVTLVHGENSGVAFSLLNGSEAVVIIVTLAVVGLVLVFFGSHRERRLIWLAAGLIIGGALGNLADRIRAGAVTDFIQFPHWPAFNLADASITVGVATLFLIIGRGGTAARPA